MAKYLDKPCVDIRIITIQVSRKENDEGNWRTYAVVIGHAIDEDGTKLKDIVRKFFVGPADLNSWDGDHFAADLATIAAAVEAKYDQILGDYTTP